MRVNATDSASSAMDTSRHTRLAGSSVQVLGMPFILRELRNFAVGSDAMCRRLRRLRAKVIEHEKPDG
jgi:hypothetical protein